jgi:hypothetical protein
MNRFGATRNSGQRWLLYPLVIAPLLFIGCRWQNVQGKPVVEITQVPVASLGGPAQMDSIEGRVSNVKPGEQVVLYARSGAWWLQPLTDQPYTKIKADLTWKNLTHLGSEYAALLVEPEYHPASKLVTLPSEGNGVLAVAVMKGKGGTAVETPTIHFSGYDWSVQTGVSDHGGQPYAYDSANAWTDEKGYLHLRMEYRNGRWSCAEISLNQSLGYGTYKFVVEDTAHLRPSAVIGMFTWDDARSTNFRNEMDIELSRWGNPESENAQYVVQPFYAPENLARFNVPGGVLTHEFRWEPGKVSFKTTSDSSPDRQKLISEHVFASGTPTPANEKVHIDLYDFHHSEGSSNQPNEAVIESFEFLPLQQPH